MMSMEVNASMPVASAVWIAKIITAAPATEVNVRFFKAVMAQSSFMSDWIIPYQL
jgi:hypothetical protein